MSQFKGLTHSWMIHRYFFSDTGDASFISLKKNTPSNGSYIWVSSQQSPKRVDSLVNDASLKICRCRQCKSKSTAVITSLIVYIRVSSRCSPRGVDSKIRLLHERLFVVAGSHFGGVVPYLVLTTNKNTTAVMLRAWSLLHKHFLNWNLIIDHCVVLTP